MIRGGTRFVIALLLLLSWQVPAFASIEVGLHLAGHHHSRESLTLELELALAASHGHHHEIGATPHQHSAVPVATPAALTPEVAALAVVPAVVVAASLLSRAERCESPPGTGPPEIFNRLCALRL